MTHVSMESSTASRERSIVRGVVEEERGEAEDDGGGGWW